MTTITPVTPAPDAVDVDKAASIKFVIEATSTIDLHQTVVRVRGAAVYNGGKIADGWIVTFVGSSTEKACEVIAPTLERWRALEQVAVHATAVDVAAQSADERWSFTAIRTLRTSIYPMILGGVRKQDEG